MKTNLSVKVSKSKGLSALMLICSAIAVSNLTAGEKIGFMELSHEQAKQLINPVNPSDASLKKGKRLFSQHCAGCHDRDGKGRSAVMGNAADLTRPSTWSQGNSDGEIFRTLRDGAGNNMPPFKYTINRDSDFWHLVNYVNKLKSNTRTVEEPST